MPPKRDINKIGFENAEFPILCETCLGPNPYVRMSKQEYGAECKTCTRPFTLFRWMPGAGMRFKKTEVCQTCAKMKNVCQTCLLDLQYQLPTQVRDAALQREGDGAPKDNINKAYIAQNAEGNLEGLSATSFGKADPATKEILKRLARNDPNYNRNKPKPCSFFAKGQCNRGDACPYRHEIVEQTGPMAKQSIQDRYHGRNDPVARQILARNANEMGLAAPEDQSIISFFVTALPQGTSEELIRSQLPEPQRNTIKSIVMVSTSSSAFVNFTSRETAEAAALIWGARGAQLTFDGHEKPARVQWGRSKKPKAIAPVASGSGITV